MCRSGVLGLCVGRCLSHELGKNHVWARPAVSVTSFCLETDQHHASSVAIAIFRVGICRKSLARLFGCARAVNGRRRSFVSSVETPCRAEMNRESGKARTGYASVPRSSRSMLKRFRRYTMADRTHRLVKLAKRAPVEPISFVLTVDRQCTIQFSITRRRVAIRAACFMCDFEALVGRLLEWRNIPAR